MEDFDVEYEKYKKSLLKSSYFTDNLKKKYTNTLIAEKNYIDRNGVLWKLALLSGVCGICLSLYGSFRDAKGIPALIVVIILAAIGITAFSFALRICEGFKENAGKANFYTFHYNRYIHDHVAREKQSETDALIQDMLSTIDDLQWRTAHIGKGNQLDIDELKDVLQHLKKKSAEFHDRCDHVKRYDSISSKLQDDYHFSKTICEFIEQ